jgi:hypothetical protein
MATAINDRLFLGIIEAKSFLGLSTSYSSVTVEIQEVLASNTYRLTIGTTQVSYTSDSTPTLSEIVAGIVLAITTAAIPGITATNLGSGKYGISGTSAFQLWIDDTQDVVPATSEDSLVASLIIVAKQMADNYCMNWFVVTDDYGRYLDSLGELVDELDDAELADIPEAVKFGVKLFLKQLYFQYNSSALVGGISGPLTHIRVGDQTISSGTGSSVYTSDSLAELARNTLSPYRVWYTPQHDLDEVYNVDQS